MARHIFPLFMACFFFSSGAYALPDVKKQALQLYRKMTVSASPTTEAAAVLVEELRENYDFHLFFSRCSADIEDQLSAEQTARLKTRFEELFFLNLKKNAKNIAKKRILQPALKSREISTQLAEVTFSGIPESEMLKHLGNDLKKLEVQFILTFDEKIWRLVDIAVEGALLSRQYRGSFNKIFRDKGYDGLLYYLERKMNEL